MITTVTANPSLDRTLRLPRFVAGEVNRATSTLVEPSGKGVNVALALHGVGVPVRAVLPVGGGTGDEIVTLLDDFGLEHVGVPIGGALRSNVTLVEADGRTSKINEPGPRLSDSEVEALCAAALSAGEAGDWVVWSGSLPDGFRPHRLAAAVTEAREAGRRVAVDCSGAPLAAVLEAATVPDLVKPNADELAEVTNRSLRTLGDVIEAAGLLRARGVHTVLVSLGADGALLHGPDLPEPVHGSAPARRVVNTAGAGDAFLAGWLAAAHAGASSVEAFAGALRFGAAAVEHGGTLLGVPDPRRRVSIAPARPETPLS
ncbi:1-phosphofructokinase family hexose kinase [Mycolicibacterium flavescens]|uniref:1-phosphofructokinase n=1 Tax=Mycolicibacterium flavescens TaxID=1776 RepID=A0A1E3RQS1_MYCFV|nr:1-phosphofructokinase family hexose kinase [Mycolicibacterium flavescens]MCV7279539.1 1-phosphofructokinase family hexose kinase [Mycolicibacterium flavescens]ODQ92198.1 1-phosphofructokinase [Mycolicibacterium flavescens]